MFDIKTIAQLNKEQEDRERKQLERQRQAAIRLLESQGYVVIQEETGT